MPIHQPQPLSFTGSPNENWVCLACNLTLCSRYVQAHAEAHWEATMFAEEDITHGGHCVVRLES